MMHSSLLCNTSLVVLNLKNNYIHGESVIKIANALQSVEVLNMDLYMDMELRN